MTNIVFGAKPHDHTLCDRDGQIEDAYWYCSETAIPGAPWLCAGCLIAVEQHHVAAERASQLRSEARRVFPVTVTRTPGVKP